MGTYFAILESEEHWRAISRKQAVFRSFLVHSLVWTSVIWLAAKYTVPQFRDAGSVHIELQSQLQAPVAASRQGQALRSPTVAPPRSARTAPRPVRIARTPTVDSRRAIRVNAAHARHAAAIAKAGGSFVHMRKPGQSAPTLGKPKPVPAGATVAMASVPQISTASLHSSAGTHLSKNPGVMSKHEQTVETKSTFAEMDARACKLYFEGEGISSANPAKAMKNWSEALVIMQEAVPLLKREVGENHSEVAFATWNLGRCYEKTGDLDEAVECYSDSARLEEKVNGRASLHRAITLVHLSDALKLQRKYADAKTALLASFPAYEMRYGVDSKEVSWSHTRLMELETLLETSAFRRPVFDWITTYNIPGWHGSIAMPPKTMVRYAPPEILYYVPDSELGIGMGTVRMNNFAVRTK